MKTIDGHAHIFPPLATACGLPDAATHLLYQQRAMHTHGNQPVRRLRDDAIIATTTPRKSTRAWPCSPWIFV